MAHIIRPKNQEELHHRKHHTALDSLFRYAEFLNFGQLHVKFDHETGLRAIVAIHSLKNGPAIGGARLVPYPTSDAALEDVLRLAFMMSFKAAISNLPHGGAKAVLMKPKHIKDRKRYFEVFGDFIEELGGKYISAMDSGTDAVDMDVIATRTSYITCTTENGGDPSPQTALGVLRGIEAAIKFKLGKTTLENLHVAVQGAGHVGYYLIKELAQSGAKLTVCDVSSERVKKCVNDFGVTPVSPEEIYDVTADVFAPCALGAVLNLDTIMRLKVPVVVGSANNQLAHHQHASLLHERGILYAPDFVVNAGGLIYVSAFYDHADVKQAFKQVENIYDTLMGIFEAATQQNLPTNVVAEQLALQKLLTLR